VVRTALSKLGLSPRAEVIYGGLTLGDPAPWRAHSAYGSAFTGHSVSVDQALRLSTVWACVRLISETIATLPLGFYQRNADGSRKPATQHNLYDILHNQPNAEQTAVVFWTTTVACLQLWGNAFTEIRRRGETITSLGFLHPARVTYRRIRGGGYTYYYWDEETSDERIIPEDRMMHIPSPFTLNGKFGLSPIAYGVNVFGTSIETDRTAAETFTNSLRSPGIVTMDQVFSKDQREQVRAHVKRVQQDGGVFVLEKGASFQQLGFDPVSAELLASRAWNVEEICRWYGIDPAMIGHGAKDSNWGTGLEQKMLWLIMFTLRKWIVNIEQSIRKSLLTPTERLRYFAEFNIEGLQRGDSAGRANYYSTMTQNGAMTRDEVRQKENLPPMGGNAAVLTVQSNMLPLDRLGENLPKPGDTGDRRRDTDQPDMMSADEDDNERMQRRMDAMSAQIALLAAQVRAKEPA
jgi:HK97 family phage portal protein